MLYFSLTIWAVLMMGQKTNEDFFLTDPIGRKHEMAKKFFVYIMVTSWFCHMVACGFTVCYYGSHPSSVSLTDLDNKWKIHMFGKERKIPEAFCQRLSQYVKH